MAQHSPIDEPVQLIHMKNLIITFLLSLVLPLQAGIRERVHLISDKEVYLSGEKILVTLRTTNEKKQKLIFSKIAYAELADSAVSHAQAMTLVSDGMGTMALSIPEDLPTGYYRLIAYTRYMLNESADIRNEKLIAVINPKTLNIKQLTGSSEQHLNSDLQSSLILRCNQKTYQQRQKGEISIDNLPDDLVSYTLSIASDLPNIPIPLAGNTLSEPLQPVSTRFLAEYEGSVVRARITGMQDDSRKLLLSVPGRNPEVFTGKKLDTGEYEFITGALTGVAELATTLDTRDDERYTIDFVSPYAPVQLRRLPVLKIDSTLTADILRRHVALQVRSAFGLAYEQETPARMVQSTSTPEWTYILKEYTRFNTIEEVILEYVTNVRFRKIGNIRTLAINREGSDGYTMGNTLVLLDNVPVFSHELLLQYDADRIEKIDIYRKQHVFGGQLYDGIVAFKSYEGNFRGFQLDRSTLISSYKGPQAGVTLTKPDRAGAPKNLPDVRTTLYWQSGNKPDTRIPFETSDVSGHFKVVLVGLRRDGQEVKSTTRFYVR